jgi:hypothetical protein
MRKRIPILVGKYMPWYKLLYWSVVGWTWPWRIRATERTLAEWWERHGRELQRAALDTWIYGCGSVIATEDGEIIRACPFDVRARS